MVRMAGLVILLGASIAVACGDDNPTTPTGTSVIVYQDTNYRGDSRPVVGNVPDMGDLPGCGGAGAPWDDCISSIRIPAGWQVIIYDSDNYTGNSMTLTADTPDLEKIAGPCGNDWDDCIDSMQVRPPS